MGAEPGVRGGARSQGRRGEDLMLRKQQLGFRETEEAQRESSSLFQEKNLTITTTRLVKQHNIEVKSSLCVMNLKNI